MNDKLASISFTDPTKLCPWRKFSKKRRFDADDDFIKADIRFKMLVFLCLTNGQLIFRLKLISHCVTKPINLKSKMSCLFGRPDLFSTAIKSEKFVSNHL